MHHHYYIKHFVRDLFIVLASIFVAILLVNAGIIESFIEATSSYKALSSFIAGAFFTSIFTVAPAGVALIAISNSFPPVLTAFFGAIGAMLVDVLIISFIRKDISKDIDGLTRMTFKHHLVRAFHFGFLKWFAFAGGIFLLATPLPDEPGLLLIGLSKINPSFLPFIFFISHFLGILVVVSIAAAI
jgi:hypothetical protein